MCRENFEIEGRNSPGDFLGKFDLGKFVEEIHHVYFLYTLPELF